jgi:hypothetical protein
MRAGASTDRVRWMRHHLSYANVMATIALFLSLAGGTAVAAKLITGASVKDSSHHGE